MLKAIYGVHGTIDRITSDNVKAAVKGLKKDKCSGPDKITSEHLIFAHEKLYVFLSLVFNACLIHGYLPDELMRTIIVPIVKDQKGDITDVNNYRPIAINSPISKVIELVILDMFKELLTSNDHQFGFKKKHGTDFCVFSLKQVVDYYTNNSTNVYACFLDASKAFDKVNHFHLFRQLLHRGIPVLFVRLLFYWYRNQKCAVRWGSSVSNVFMVTNGVRQGSVLSPILYNLFIEQLSVLLLRSNVGCKMNGMFLNHLFYADDSILLAPTPSSLQKLLNICEDFSRDFELFYNVEKTKCIMFCCKMFQNIKSPTVVLNGDILKFVTQVKYLGMFLVHDVKDIEDMKRQMSSFYSRGNTIIRKFRCCTDSVKTELFKTFVANMYGSELWCDFTKAVYHKLRVSYNKVFRHLMGIAHGESISNNFVCRRLFTFIAMWRNYITKFMGRLDHSENSIISNICNSLFFSVQSKLNMFWTKLVL